MFFFFPFQVKETLSEDHKPDSWSWSLGGCLKNSSTSTPGIFSSTFVQHIYTYICVLDFEATCDREPGKVEKEVLAIPVVLLDAGYVCATCDSSGAARVLH